jgi:hypothetical protein
MPWVVLTDEPDDFSDLPVRAIHHTPTGPMADDYLKNLPPTGQNRGAAAYHDKRFALMAALENYDTAIYMDADSTIKSFPVLDSFPAGLAVYPLVRKSVEEHLTATGTWRMPIFVDLARHLTGSTEIMREARWCHETPVAVTKNGRESSFFEAWSIAASFLQSRNVYSGEGGVIGLAAAYAGWSVDYDSIVELARFIEHESGGPKSE